MSDFVLEISGAGEAITLEPIGCVDRQGAQTLIEAVESVQSARHTPLLEIRTDRITGCTADAGRAAGPQRPARPGPGRLNRRRLPAAAALSPSAAGRRGQVVVARDRLVGLLRRGAVATRHGHRGCRRR